MTDMRYEEYSHEEGKSPLYLQPLIQRDAVSSAQEPNWHDNPELQWCISGEGAVLLDGEVSTFRPGDIAAVNPHVIHRTYTDGRLQYGCLIMDPEFCIRAGIDCRTLRMEPHIRCPELSALLERLTAVNADRENICREAEMQKTALEILILLRRRFTADEGAHPTDFPSAARVRGAILYIREHFGEALSLEQIARQVCIDKFSLSREFRRVTGRTVVQYINNYRCIRAAEYIGEGLSVSEAAQKCGFRNMSYFTRTFRAYFHVLPSEKRKKSVQISVQPTIKTR